MSRAFDIFNRLNVAQHIKYQEYKPDILALQEHFTVKHVKSPRLSPNTLGSWQATSQDADLSLIATRVAVYCKPVAA